MYTPKQAFDLWKPSYGVELVYFDYRDHFTDEQAEWFVTGDHDKIWFDVEDWFYDARILAADELAKEIIAEVQERDPDFEPEQEWLDEVLELLLDNDQTDVIHELAKRSHFDVTLSGDWLISEDDALWAETDPAVVVEALGVPSTKKNLEVAAEILAESPTDLGMAFPVFSVPVKDLADKCVSELAISASELPVVFGNPFTGAYWHGVFELDTPRQYKLTDMAANRNHFGYSVEDVYGGFPPELAEAKWSFAPTNDN